MSDEATAVRPPSSTPAAQPLAERLATTIVGQRDIAVTAAATEKLKVCVLDFLACAFESRNLPWARQAQAIATDGAGPCSIVGTALAVPAPDAVFANSVAGHGLVREDMHTGSVSHLGIVVLPVLLALAEERKVDGRAFIAAAVNGYEVGGKIGRSLVTPDFARIFRPTGFCGPMAAAAAASTLLRFDAKQTQNAISLAANMVAGQNQWPHTGADEMFFEAGQAARNGLTAARLAGLGAYGSEKALDGEAGLFTAYRPDKQTPDVRLFDGEPEILSVFFKPAPVCNFAQTPSLAALALANAEDIDPDAVVSINAKVTRAAKAYPGCDYAGPFSRILQAKMSIHYAVASVILGKKIDESSYTDLDSPALLRLAALVAVEVDPDLTAAFPARQGAEVIVEMKDGRRLSRRLPDVIPADLELIRRRFSVAASEAIGSEKAAALAAAVDSLDSSDDVGALMRMTRAT